MDHIFLDGKVYNDLKFGFINTYKKETCSARNILQAMDLASGFLSLSSIETLRSVEDLDH